MKRLSHAINLKINQIVKHTHTHTKVLNAIFTSQLEIFQWSYFDLEYPVAVGVINAANNLIMELYM